MPRVFAFIASALAIVTVAAGLLIQGVVAVPSGASRGAEVASAESSEQPVFDDKRRIVGWLRRDPALAASPWLPLWPFLAFTSLAALALAVVSLALIRGGNGRRQAHLDAMTGLPDFYGLREAEDEALAGLQPGDVLCLAHLVVDRFEDLTLELGRQRGDDMLVEFASRLRDLLPAGSVLGRVAGDGFGVLTVARSERAAMRAVEDAIKGATKSIRAATLPGFRTAGGAALAPRDGRTREELMGCVQLALRSAKRRGRGSFVFFDPALAADMDEARFIRRELALALSEYALDLHYQPIVAADSGAVVGVEALLRWNHPQRGLIPPGTFVRVAEEAGLMDRLGQFVLRRALADAAEWPDLYVAVNLSPLQMRDPSLVRGISALLAETHFNPSRLVLEITEGVLIDNPDEMRERLEELRALGVRLALDDFGSGYSSLGYLQKLPFDKLKIDRSFVTALTDTQAGPAILQAVVAIGRALGMSVLVEGVETETQRALLRLAGCNEMQGYLFAKPVPRGGIGPLLMAA